MAGKRTRNPRGSVVLSKRVDGNHIWQYRWTNAAGKQPAVQFADLAKFRNVTMAWQEAERQGLPAKYLGLKRAEMAARKTFRNIIDRYTIEMMPERFSTSHGYKSWLQLHISPRWGAAFIEDVQPDEVELWLKGLALAPKSKGHIKGLMTILFNQAMKWRWIPVARNPMELVTIKGGTRRKSRPQILREDQFHLLLSNIPERYVQVVVIVSMCLGLRFSEALALKWSDVKWGELLISISRGIVQGRVGPVKSEYSDAPAPLDPDLAEILLDWKRETEFPKEEDWMFASPFVAGEAPYFPTAIRRKIHAAAKEAGLGNLLAGEPTKIMRHSYRSWLGTTDAPLAVIKDLLRHSDIRTTMNEYGDVMPGPMRVANSKVVKMALAKK